MDTNIKVIEAHLDSGKTLPLKFTTTKAGEPVWAVLDAKPNGDRFFNGFGAMVVESKVGHPDQIKTIKVEGVGTLNVKHEVTQPTLNKKSGKWSKGGKARAIASKSFTSPVDHEEWTLNFRATLMEPGVVNLLVSIKRGAVSKRRVLTEL